MPDDYTGKGTEEVVFEIKDGQIASDVAQELERQGVVASARAFTNAIGNAGKSDALQPGTYKVRKKMPAADVVKLLLDPKQQVLMKVRLAEGLRLSDIYTKLAEQTGLDRKKFEAAAKNVDNLDLPAYAKGKLEGYAFPATYDFPPKATAGDVLARMVQRFHQAAEKADLVGGAKSLGHTPHEIVTIASIIQAEAGRHEDMPKIARVIYNRLNRQPPMTLSMDSTVMYAWKATGPRPRTPSWRSSPRTTRTRTSACRPARSPIPGDHAIEAALNPAKGSWLFFVATDPKSKVTEFATTDAEFQALEAKLRRNGG